MSFGVSDVDVACFGIVKIGDGVDDGVADDFF